VISGQKDVFQIVGNNRRGEIGGGVRLNENRESGSWGKGGPEKVEISGIARKRREGSSGVGDKQGRSQVKGISNNGLVPQMDWSSSGESGLRKTQPGEMGKGGGGGHPSKTASSHKVDHTEEKG